MDESFILTSSAMDDLRKILNRRLLEPEVNQRFTTLIFKIIISGRLTYKALQIIANNVSYLELENISISLFGGCDIDDGLCESTPEELEKMYIDVEDELPIL